MIKTKISNDIWNLKYRFENETEEAFYTRIVEGLLSDVDKKVLSKYSDIIGVESGNLITTVVEYFRNHECMLAGRPTYSLGTTRKQQTFSNCYVIPIESDSMVSIMEAVSNAALTMRAGGGVGYNFSILRPRNSIIHSSGAKSTGVLSFMNIFNTVCGSIAAGGNRRGAQIGILGVWHPDVLDFISCKRGNEGLPEELCPYKNFNLSLMVPDAFIEAVRKDSEWELVFPDTSFPEYDKEWDGNISAWKAKGYPVIIHDNIRARDLWDKVMESNYNFAEPGVLFEDTINRLNPLWMNEYIMAVNPCGEQPLIPYGSCNLGSLNLTQYVVDAFTEDCSFAFERFANVVKSMVILMDRMLDLNYYPLEKQAKVVKQKRQIGLGITGLGDMLAMLRLKYSSSEGRLLVEKVMSVLRETAFDTSAELAKHLGAFPEWYNFSDETKDAFVTGPYISTLSGQTLDKIRKYGLRNSRLLSIAPTGTISLLMNNVSSGGEPIFLLEYTRKVKTSNEETLTETVETYSWLRYKEFIGEDSPDKPEYFETTADLDVDAHVDMQALLQRYICTAISKTINIPEDYPYEDFKKVYTKAHSVGIKGCTTYRPNATLGAVLSEKGSKSSLCSEENRPKGIVFHCAPKRPKELLCNIHHVVVKGAPWLVLMGILNDNAYEIFCGEGTDLYIPKNCKEGLIIKNPGGKYSLIIRIRGQEVEYKDLAHTLMTTEQRAITRLISLSLRHGTPLEFIQEQLKKANGDITDYSTCIARVLGSYIKEYKYTKAGSCPNCGEQGLVRKEGCMSCSQCGYSKCG